jgi:hypothetical protein
MADTRQPKPPADTEGKGDTRARGLIAITTTQPGGRRRAGFSFGASPTEIDWSDLSEDQRQKLLDDPTLSIKPVQPAA